MPSVLWCCWLGGRKGIRPVKNWVVGCWRAVWSEVQTCICPSWCHWHSLSLASVKSRLVSPFRYRLTWVVPEKGPLNGCVFVCSYSIWAHYSSKYWYTDSMLRLMSRIYAYIYEIWHAVYHNIIKLTYLLTYLRYSIQYSELEWVFGTALVTVTVTQNIRHNLAAAELHHDSTALTMENNILISYSSCWICWTQLTPLRVIAVNLSMPHALVICLLLTTTKNIHLMASFPGHPK